MKNDQVRMHRYKYHNVVSTKRKNKEDDRCNNGIRGKFDAVLKTV
jgi:hypothetical protein